MVGEMLTVDDFEDPPAHVPALPQEAAGGDWQVQHSTRSSAGMLRPHVRPWSLSLGRGVLKRALGGAGLAGPRQSALWQLWEQRSLGSRGAPGLSLRAVAVRPALLAACRHFRVARERAARGLRLLFGRLQAEAGRCASSLLPPLLQVMADGAVSSGRLLAAAGLYLGLYLGLWAVRKPAEGVPSDRHPCTVSMGLCWWFAPGVLAADE